MHDVYYESAKRAESRMQPSETPTPEEWAYAVEQVLPQVESATSVRDLYNAVREIWSGMLSPEIGDDEERMVIQLKKAATTPSLQGEGAEVSEKLGEAVFNKLKSLGV